MRFVFFIPVSPVVRGGISIAIDMIEVLNANGIEAIALYDRPDFENNLHVARPPRMWSPTVRKPRRPGLKQRLRDLWDFYQKPHRRTAGNAPDCPRWDVRPDDCVVVPEFSAGWLPHGLPAGLPLILFTQNPFSLFNASTQPGFDAGLFKWSLASSDACANGSAMILKAQPDVIPVYISHELYAYQPDKTFQVAYMPRKRDRHVGVLVKALRDTPALRDVSFVPIDGLKPDDAARVLRDSLIFLSMSEQEGFGLPAAEAMATGALVVGYSGVGGDEFFTDKTGFPIPEDNLMQMYDTTVALIAGYRADPKPYDALRKQASDTILQAYPYKSFEREVVKTFKSYRTRQSRG